MSISELNKDPLKYLEKLTNEEIVNILHQADNAFFNENETLFTDDVYDIIKDYLQKKDPKNPYFQKVGADVNYNKEKLPFYMGSLDKIKDNEKELDKWKKTYSGPYVISEKLDGISCLLYNNNLYTRGNGIYGQNITHILPYLKLPDIPSKIAIRGELIISKSNWSKIKDTGANARNVVAGAVHSKTISPIISYVNFIAYDVLHPKNNLENSLEFAKTFGIPIVNYIKLDEISMENLSNILQEWRKISKYEIDGIVICNNDVHKLVANKNPKYAFAFKTILTHEQAEVIVTDVEWNISKDRYLKPIVKFNEINLNGVKIKQATGFNANFIEKNKIGVGSRIIIIRSGDVIPHILSVLSEAKYTKLPDIPYKWNETGIDIILDTNEKNREHDIQSFTYFMKTINVEGIKEGIITKLYDAGYDTLPKIINISLDELKMIDTFKEKSANNIFDALQTLKKVECHKLMIASNIFGRGFGEKKLKLILDKYPSLAIDKDFKVSIIDLTNIKGIAEITALQFIEGLPKYFDFLQSLTITCTSPEEKLIKKILGFKDKKIVFSGFRNKEYEKLIEESGGKIISTISKSTDYLIIKEDDIHSAKVVKANELGIKILTKEEFEKLI